MSPEESPSPRKPSIKGESKSHPIDWLNIRSALGEPEELPANFRVFSAGKTVKAVYILSSGAVKILRQRDDREVLLAFRTPPRLLGAVSAALGNVHLATAVTLTACEVQPMPVAEFHALRKNDMQFGEWLQRTFASEAQTQMDRVTALAAAGVRERIERTLIDLAIAFGNIMADGSLRIDLPITVTALADLALTARAPGSKLLTRFEREGLVYRRKGWFTIPTDSRLLSEVHDGSRML